MQIVLAILAASTQGGYSVGGGEHWEKEAAGGKKPETGDGWVQ